MCYGGKHSFAAPYANYECQIDFFITELENQTYNIGMACNDISSTKYATVVPRRSKQTSEHLAGLMACLRNMRNKPKIISLTMRALSSNAALGYLTKEKILLQHATVHILLNVFSTDLR